MHTHSMDHITTSGTDLKTPVRNRYFYGKLLDVFHFELETNYLNAKRWLLNRMVSGYGVVCGLDVQPGPNRTSFVVTPGFALDKWGREIIVPKSIGPLAVPADLLTQPKRAEVEITKQVEHEHRHEAEGNHVTVVLCYHECESDPAPVLAGDCSSVQPCEAGVIREQFRIDFRAGAAPPIEMECRYPDVIEGRDLDYKMLAQWITKGCGGLPADPCIPLANLRLTEEKDGYGCDAENIDISVRPIVYTNDVLFDLLLSMLHETAEYRRGK